MAIKIRDLIPVPGSPPPRFRLPDSGKTGVVIEQGICGTTVRYDGVRRVKGKSGRTDEEFEFEAPRRSVYISNATEVVPL